MEYKFLSYCTMDELKLLKDIIEGENLEEKDKMLKDIKMVSSSKNHYDYNFCSDSIPYYQIDLESKCNDILKQLDLTELFFFIQ